LVVYLHPLIWRDLVKHIKSSGIVFTAVFFGIGFFRNKFQKGLWDKKRILSLWYNICAEVSNNEIKDSSLVGSFS